MLTGKHPFDLTNNQTLVEDIKNGEIISMITMNEQSDLISDQAIELVKDMMKTDPADRVSAKEALNYEWINMELKEIDQHMEWVTRGLSKHVESKQS